MNLHQIVITKNVMGKYKLMLMGDGVTQEVQRGELCLIAWLVFRQMFRLKALQNVAPNI